MRVLGYFVGDTELRWFDPYRHSLYCRYRLWRLFRKIEWEES